MCILVYFESIEHYNVLPCVHCTLTTFCAVVQCMCHILCERLQVFLSTLLHPVNIHVTPLIIPLQTAGRAPVETLSLELDLFHLKDQFCFETQTSKVTFFTKYKLERRGAERGKERKGCLGHMLQNFKDSTLILCISGKHIVG